MASFIPRRNLRSSRFIFAVQRQPSGAPAFRRPPSEIPLPLPSLVDALGMPDERQPSTWIYAAFYCGFGSAGSSNGGAGGLDPGHEVLQVAFPGGPGEAFASGA